MKRVVWVIRGLPFLLVGCLFGVLTSTTGTAQDFPYGGAVTISPNTPSSPPIEITADRLEYSKNTEIYLARGSVKFVQGSTRLTADHVTVRMLDGKLTATGRVHLSKKTSELWAERLEININTEGGIITNGTLFDKETHSLISARRFQRFSEDHYRAKDGSFTTCNAMEGETPAWRFQFQDVDVNIEEGLYLKNAWFCIHDVPVLPLPTFNYPVGISRKTGFLFPTPGYNSEFGFTYRQGFFWAVNPSHDLTITPTYFSKRGYGGDLEYRYALSRRTKGQWLVNAIRDTTKTRTRSLVSGSHTSQINPDLVFRAKMFLVSDRTYLQDLSSSGVFRVLPSADSSLDVRRRFTNGGVYLLGNFLQPLGAGGGTTFQRLPELGVRLADVVPFNSPLRLGFEGTTVQFFREEGFSLHRADFMPILLTKPFVVGNVISFTPEVRPRGVFYSRGVATKSTEHRETFWLSLRADTRMQGWFGQGNGEGFLHTLEPNLIYEFVPPSDQSNIVQVDDVDDLSKKSLLTYKIRSRLLRVRSKDTSSNWLDLTLAQSYRMGAVQTRARRFPFPGTSEFNTLTQPLQLPTVPIQGRKFSDVWMRGIWGMENFGWEAGRSTSQYLTVDSFFDPYRERFRQVNTDLRVQYDDDWYLQAGHRYTRSGNRVRRGDVWNPISFGDLFEPTPEILYLTASGGVRTPFGWTIGAKAYHNLDTRETLEFDVVALYQNPCRCWSLGLSYIKFPDRDQINAMINLTGIGNTGGFGTDLMKSLLDPLLQGEKGLPW